MELWLLEVVVCFRQKRAPGGADRQVGRVCYKNSAIQARRLLLKKLTANLCRWI